MSTAEIDMDDDDIDDLERYLQVKRGEIAFANGVLLVEVSRSGRIRRNNASPEDSKRSRAERNCGLLGGRHQFRTLCEAAPFPNALDVPFAVLTDYDPQDPGEALSITRVRTLLDLIDEEIHADRIHEERDLWVAAEEHGIFVNEYTSRSRSSKVEEDRLICNAIRQSASNQALRERICGWKEDPDSLDEEQFLKDVKTISKGRLGQRMASRILVSNCENCPDGTSRGQSTTSSSESDVAQILGGSRTAKAKSGSMGCLRVDR